MGLPAARATDLQVCPASTGPVPHVGGPITMGEPTVLIGSLPAARMGDPCTCVGPSGTVLGGSATVMIGNKPAARLTDPAGHGGTISGPGCATVLIG